MTPEQQRLVDSKLYSRKPEGKASLAAPSGSAAPPPGYMKSETLNCGHDLAVSLNGNGDLVLLQLTDADDGDQVRVSLLVEEACKLAITIGYLGNEARLNRERKAAKPMQGQPDAGAD